MAKLLGIDIGTTACKALLLDETGKVLRSATSEYPLHTPRPLWSEQNPEDWWQAVQECLSQINEPQPDAIGLTGQMHGAVFLDQQDEPVRPAILWNDQRTHEECEEIETTVGSQRVRTITGNPPLTGFQAPKILWLRNHELSRFQRVRTVLLPKDYIRLRLTGERFTDVADASGTGLFNLRERRWSLEMMAELELDPDLFPPSAESTQVVARTREGLPGLKAGIAVVAGAGDQAAAAIGTGAISPGVVSVSLGTSGVVFRAQETPRHDPEGRLHAFCHANGAWHTMGVMLSCGGAIKWYRDAFAQEYSYDELAALAQTAPPGGNGLTFLPYLSGERTPHNDPQARAAFAGATLAHGPADFARAVFESASFGLRDCLDLIAREEPVTEVRLTGGGARSPFWRQMLADVFQTRCWTLSSDEGPAYGAALLAGVGIGIWPTVHEATQSAVKLNEATEPSGVDYAQFISRFRHLYRALKPWMSDA
jgi:xylulokinase